MTGQNTTPGCLAMCLAVLLTSVTGLAQTPVDFSGTWVAAEQPERKGGVKEVLVINQDGRGMTVEFTAEGQKQSEMIRYEFGATKEQSKSGPAGIMTAVVTTRWEGEKLIATNTVQIRDRKRSFRQVWSKDSAGQLVLTVTDETAGKAISTTQTYKRSQAKGS